MLVSVDRLLRAEVPDRRLITAELAGLLDEKALATWKEKRQRIEEVRCDGIAAVPVAREAARPVDLRNARSDGAQRIGGA
jgi:hypothetical protein